MSKIHNSQKENINHIYLQTKNKNNPKEKNKEKFNKEKEKELGNSNKENQKNLGNRNIEVTNKRKTIEDLIDLKRKSTVTLKEKFFNNKEIIVEKTESFPLFPPAE